MQRDLRVAKVYVKDGKQMFFDVLDASNYIRNWLSKSQICDETRRGYKFVNATISDSGEVQVDSDVPREQLQEVKSVTRASTMTEKRIAFEAVKQYAKSLGINIPDYFRVTGNCSVNGDNFIIVAREMRSFKEKNPHMSDDELREVSMNLFGCYS